MSTAPTTPMKFRRWRFREARLDFHRWVAAPPPGRIRYKMSSLPTPMLIITLQDRTKMKGLSCAIDLDELKNFPEGWRRLVAFNIKDLRRYLRPKWGPKPETLSTEN